MSEIKHLLYESGVEETFALVVEDSQYAGTYEIEMPDKFYEIDSVIDINEDYFNIDNIILGDTEKIRFLEYSNPVAYDIVKKVYEEKGGDGKIIFQWKAKKGNDEVDLLGSGYELNLNKYSRKFEQSMMVIETEIKKREVQNKFLTREDVSVNLFSEKDLDNNEIEPLNLDYIFYKDGDRLKSNFYSMHTKGGGLFKRFMFMFTRPFEYDLGNIANEYVGWNYNSSLYKGPLMTATVMLPNLILEISNLEVITYTHFALNILITNGAAEVRRINNIIEPTTVVKGGSNWFEFKVENQTFDIGILNQGESVHLLFETTNNEDGLITAVKTTTSLELKSNFETPLRKSGIIRLQNAIRRIFKLYTGVDCNLQSTIINQGGFYYNTAVSIGMFMRGLPEIYNTNKITTSFKSLFYESVSKLMALGFDIQDDKLIVEDIYYFFKDVESYNFTDKEFIQEDYVFENDIDNSFNQLNFGSKKFSTNKKGDLKNYNTKLEAVTPLKSAKTKFDKQIDAIIDEDKITELIYDKSTKTNDNDDDLILIDLVEFEVFQDSGILADCEHISENGYLWLSSIEIPFDVLAIKIGQNLTIETGLNAGTYEVLEINKDKIKLNKTSNIQSGNNDTPISYNATDIVKNRNNEGFSIKDNTVTNKKSVTNIRHNPKYQMARWFPYFGSGLNNKLDLEEIIVTNYKNNGEVEISPNSPELSNELQGNTTFKANETLERLRDHKQPIFNGQKIEITLTEVLFHEYWECFNKWRNERGFITVQTPEGEKNIFPFGKKAFSFNGQLNELTIKGKVKNTI